MLKKIICFFPAVLMVCLSANLFAQSKYSIFQIPTQQIGLDDLLTMLRPASTVLHSSSVTVPLVSITTSSCSAWYQVQCNRWNDVTQQWDCNCQSFWCSSGWTKGSCPVPQ